MFNTRKIAARSAVLLCAILVSFCGSAAAQTVHYNFVAGTDFSKFKTYKWVEIQGGSHPDQMLNDQVRQAIDSQLVAKGLTKTDSDQADLYIDYQTAVTQEKQWDAMGYGGVRYGRMGTATTSTINIGTLVLDMYDSATKKQVWRGDASKTLNPSKDPRKNQERLQKAMAKLLKNYPPPVKK